MAYSFQDRLRHTGNRLEEVAGETVSVTRGVLEIVAALTVVPVLQEAEEIVPGVSVTRVEHQDFSFKVADYVDGMGNKTEPQSGDIFTRSNGEKFRLVPNGADGAVYRYTTSSRERYIVTTERTSRELSHP